MADYLSVARPYAKAAFAFAAEKNCLAEWQQELQLLATMVENPQIQSILKDPEISSQRINQFLLESLAPCKTGKTENGWQYFANFIDLLVENKRLFALPDIYRLFQELLIEQEHLVKVEVTSAFALNENQRTQLATALSQRFAAKVAMDFRVDRDLIGGAIIRSGNWVLDGSIKGKLQRLHDQLKTMC